MRSPQTNLERHLAFFGVLLALICLPLKAEAQQCQVLHEFFHPSTELLVSCTPSSVVNDTFIDFPFPFPGVSHNYVPYA
ncbi:MAG: hypothetical protein KDD53_03550, partial [Bdellovibrionales bacterium]|nr:hypothetical protein [Bdellovibrionales bacterium]